MVLEYIDGPPLSKLRGMLKSVGQLVDDTTALYTAACIFDALAAAHGATNEAGEPAPVIHRDVNPSNVLIPWDAG
jgi:serine/threonine-protein kinase